MAEPLGVRDLLRGIRVFSALDDSRLAEVAAIARLLCVSAGKPVVEANEAANELFAVVEGRVEISIPIPGRDPRAVSTVSAGEILGWSALLAQSRWLANARALKNTTVVVLPGQELLELCEKDHELGYQVMHYTFETVAQRLHDTWLQVTDSYRP